MVPIHLFSNITDQVDRHIIDCFGVLLVQFKKIYINMVTFVVYINHKFILIAVISHGILIISDKKYMNRKPFV